MRSAVLLGGLACIVLIGSTTRSRAEPYDAVLHQDADVRSGHGDGTMFYPTNHLHVGDRVRVVKEEAGGWLAIVPPSGSFSWVRKDLLYTSNQQPPVTAVNADADVRIGSTLTNQPPVVGKREPRGTIVYMLPKNNEVRDGDGVWVSIYPPEGEVRYIRAEAIQSPTGAGKTTTVVTVPPAGIPTGAARTEDAETLYRQAVAAEKFNPQQSIALYNQGAVSDADFNRANLARNRAEWLRDNLRNPTTNLVPGLAPGADPHVAAAPSESKVYPVTSDPPTSVRLSAPQAGGAGTQYSTQPGFLRLSGRTVEGRRTFMMMSNDGRTPFYYVTAQPGVNLDPYEGRRVECYGEAIYSGDLRANYMRVSHVELREGQ